MAGIIGFMKEREIGSYRSSQYKESHKNVKDWLERLSASPVWNQPCEFSGEPKATFLVDFSPDRTKIASAHGDHTVRVTEAGSGKCTHILTGHPRTPWCLAFHPSHSDILASGCLGGQVRIWDLRGGGSEVFNSDTNSVIASLTFHPTDRVLVFSTKNTLHFWDWTEPQPFKCCATSFDYERVRWVKFDALGHFLYTGICNNTTVTRPPMYDVLSTNDRRNATAHPNWQQRHANRQRYEQLVRQIRDDQQQRLRDNAGIERPTSPVHEDRLRQAYYYARYVTSHSRDNYNWIQLARRRSRRGLAAGGRDATSREREQARYNMFSSWGQPGANSPPPRPLQDSSDSDQQDSNPPAPEAEAGPDDWEWVSEQPVFSRRNRQLRDMVLQRRPQADGGSEEAGSGLGSSSSGTHPVWRTSLFLPRPSPHAESTQTSASRAASLAHDPGTGEPRLSARELFAEERMGLDSAPPSDIPPAMPRFPSDPAGRLSRRLRRFNESLRGCPPRPSVPLAFPPQRREDHLPNPFAPRGRGWDEGNAERDEDWGPGGEGGGGGVTSARPLRPVGGVTSARPLRSERSSDRDSDSSGSSGRLFRRQSRGGTLFSRMMAEELRSPSSAFSSPSGRATASSGSGEGLPSCPFRQTHDSLSSRLLRDFSVEPDTTPCPGDVCAACASAARVSRSSETQSTSVTQSASVTPSSSDARSTREAQCSSSETLSASASQSTSVTQSSSASDICGGASAEVSRRRQTATQANNPLSSSSSSSSSASSSIISEVGSTAGTGASNHSVRTTTQSDPLPHLSSSRGGGTQDDEPSTGDGAAVDQSTACASKKRPYAVAFDPLSPNQDLSLPTPSSSVSETMTSSDCEPVHSSSSVLDSSSASVSCEPVQSSSTLSSASDATPASYDPAHPTSSMSDVSPMSCEPVQSSSAVTSSSSTSISSREPGHAVSTSANRADATVSTDEPAGPSSTGRSYSTTTTASLATSSSRPPTQASSSSAGAGEEGSSSSSGPASSSSSRLPGNWSGSYTPGSISCRYLNGQLISVPAGQPEQRASILTDINRVRRLAHNSLSWTCDLARQAREDAERCPVCRNPPPPRPPRYDLGPMSMSSGMSHMSHGMSGGGGSAAGDRVSSQSPTSFAFLARRHLQHENSLRYAGGLALERTSDGTSQTQGQLNEPEQADRGTDICGLAQPMDSVEEGNLEATPAASGQGLSRVESDLQRQLSENDDQISRIENSYLEEMQRLASERKRILSTFTHRERRSTPEWDASSYSADVASSGLAHPVPPSSRSATSSTQVAFAAGVASSGLAHPVTPGSRSATSSTQVPFSAGVASSGVVAPPVTSPPSRSAASSTTQVAFAAGVASPGVPSPVTPPCATSSTQVAFAADVASSGLAHTTQTPPPQIATSSRDEAAVQTRLSLGSNSNSNSNPSQVTQTSQDDAAAFGLGGSSTAVRSGEVGAGPATSGSSGGYQTGLDGTGRLLHTLPAATGSDSDRIEVLTGSGDSETITFSELARRLANREDVMVVGNHRIAPTSAAAVVSTAPGAASTSSAGASALATSSGASTAGGAPPSRGFLRSCLTSSSASAPRPVPPSPSSSQTVTSSAASASLSSLFLPSSVPIRSGAASTSGGRLPPVILVQQPVPEDNPQGGEGHQQQGSSASGSGGGGGGVGGRQQQGSSNSGTGGDADWYGLEQRHLHPHYSRSILDDTINRPNDSMQSAINRAIAGVFMSSGEQAVASNIVPGTHRIQRWDFRQCQIPDLTCSKANIVVEHCKIHNDASVDISRDSSLLATFVNNHGGFPDDNILAVFSLRNKTFGQCLFTKSFGPNAISVSLSPSNNYVMVGLASKRMMWVQVTDQLVGQIFKLNKAGAGEYSMLHMTDLYHPVRQPVALQRGMSPVSVNSARWLPDVGEGIVYGTNHGDLHFYRAGRTKAGVEEEESRPRKLTISTQTGTGSIRRSAFTQTTDEESSS